MFNLAFRLTRYGRRLRVSSPELHPKKAELIQLLRISAIAGFVGMLLFIIGGGVSLAIVLAKSIAQPQGVAIYDPNRIIRPLDIFRGCGKYERNCCTFYWDSDFFRFVQLAASFGC